MKAVAVLVLLFGLAACQYVIRQDFVDAKCTNGTFTQISSTACVEGEDQRYHMAMCNTDSVDIMDCEDNKCANCPHKETYNFSCNAIPMGKDYVQYSCSNALPTGPHSLTQTMYPEAAGGCMGTFSVAFVVFDMIGQCNKEGMDYVKLACNSGNVTASRCTDNMCSTGCQTNPLPACDHGTNGYTAVSCTA